MEHARKGVGYMKSDGRKKLLKVYGNLNSEKLYLRRYNVCQKMKKCFSTSRATKVFLEVWSLQNPELSIIERLW